MKLIMCPLCDDLIALRRWRKSCKCGSIYGKYLDNLTAKVAPGAILLAMDTNKVVAIDGSLYKRLTMDWEPTNHDGCNIIFEEFDE